MIPRSSGLPVAALESIWRHTFGKVLPFGSGPSGDCSFNPVLGSVPVRGSRSAIAPELAVEAINQEGIVPVSDGLREVFKIMVDAVRTFDFSGNGVDIGIPSSCGFEQAARGRKEDSALGRRLS